MLKLMEIWPGPMEGVMSAPFVRAVNRLGLVERWMTPFLRLTTACPRGQHLKTFLEPFAAGGVPVTVQLMGVDPDVIGEAAARFRDLGAAEINLNFGCPSRQVTGGGAGGGALRHPDALLRMVERVKTFLPRPPAERQAPHRLEFAGGGAPSSACSGAHRNARPGLSSLPHRLRRLRPD
ncbi:MAG: tRNA-dihydrouridine synthase [Lentisphaeria bacterium]|nr:MAG: tRNA-dihydrouridine synthase [Lentisphaeria bacterium]